MSVRLVQCLCPERHCILAIAYEPGVTAAQWNSTSDITLTEANAADYVRDQIIGPMMKSKILNPWCGLCKAKLATWTYDDSPAAAFTTVAEAEPFLREVEKANRLAREFFEKGGRN